jgi:Tol biopolymer transport system component
MLRNMKTKLLALALVFTLTVEVLNAYFTFGKPINLGSNVNSSANEYDPGISSDGLELYFHSERPGGYGSLDIWVTRRSTTKEEWGETVNLGSTVNSSTLDTCPSISPDGLALYFSSYRSGGSGKYDLWVTKRSTREDPWGPPENLESSINTSGGEAHPFISADGLSLYFAGAASPMDTPRVGGYGGGDIWLTELTTGRQGTKLIWGASVNLGATINSSVYDAAPCLSADGLMLFFHSDRTGGYGNHDIWIARRKTPDDPWEEPLNLGSPVNTSAADAGPALSGDGKTLYFFSGRTGGIGAWDLWQAPIIPIVDLNADGIVDAADMCIIVDNWGTDEPLCDIGPMPWGDSIVDVEDLIVLAEHLFEEFPPVEPVE